jgi:hypothetical protein
MMLLMGNMLPGRNIMSYKFLIPVLAIVFLAAPFSFSESAQAGQPIVKSAGDPTPTATAAKTKNLPGNNKSGAYRMKKLPGKASF